MPSSRAADCPSVRSVSTRPSQDRTLAAFSSARPIDTARTGSGAPAGTGTSGWGAADLADVAARLGVRAVTRPGGGGGRR